MTDYAAHCKDCFWRAAVDSDAIALVAALIDEHEAWFPCHEVTLSVPDLGVAITYYEEHWCFDGGDGDDSLRAVDVSLVKRKPQRSGEKP